MPVKFSLLDLLFPKKCVSCGKLGSYICSACFGKVEFIDKPICPVCQRQAVGGKTHPGCLAPLGIDGLIVACRYRGSVKLAIQKVKYKWIWDIERVFVQFLVNCLWKFDFPAGAKLVPVPLYIKRKRWRGFNQAEILAKAFAEQFGVDCCDCVIRTRETKTQVGLTRVDRKKNVRGAFGINPALDNKIVRGADFILVDDVYTSGATIMECAKALKRAGAKSVWGMAVALG